MRSLLEYSSATFSSASTTQLRKLDTCIQKIGSRLICRAPRQAHSAPLLEALNIEPLSERRSQHILELVNNIVQGKTHPALRDMFQRDPEGNIVNDSTARIQIGKRRFSIYAKNLANKLQAEEAINNGRPIL